MIFNIPVPIYNKGIIFIFGHDRPEAEAWLQQKGWLGEDGVDESILNTAFEDEHAGITCSNPKGCRLLVHVDRIDNHRSLAHEIFHASCRIMEWVDIWPLGFGNEEAFAYLIGYITEEVYTKIQEHGKQ